MLACIVLCRLVAFDSFPIASELYLVSEIIILLQQLPTPLFGFDSATYQYRYVPCCRLLHLSPDLLTHCMEHFASYATQRRVIQQFITLYSTPDTTSTTPYRCFQSFAAALQICLHRSDLLLLQFERKMKSGTDGTPITLISLQQWLQPSVKQLAFIVELLHAITGTIVYITLPSGLL